MDEVPIPTNNPVIIKPKNETKNKPKKASRLLETFKNFIYMFPLALIISYQLFWLGHRFGEFITFPPTSVITYIFLGSILLMLIVIQIMMRSILYSVLVGIMFTAGIFSAWFGNVYDPIMNNISSGIEIVKSAWTRKDIPFQLLVAGTMSSIIIGVAILQFMISLLVKSFFEMIFGKNWGDGKWMGYLGAIALIFGIHLSFNSYHKYSSDNSEKLIWKNYQNYKPMEKFITRTSGNITYNDDYIWINNGSSVISTNIKNGNEVGNTTIKSYVVCKGIQRAESPVIAEKDKFICLTDNLAQTLWEIPYPIMTASETEQLPEKIRNTLEENQILIPLTIKFIDSGKLMLAFFDYGKIALYDVKEGKELWCEIIDQPAKITRLLPDRYLDDISYLENNNKILIACKNGYVKSIDKKTGKIDWEYQHTVAKIGGKAQRGYLSKYTENAFVVAFKTGEIVTLSYKDGHIIHKAVNEAFVTNNPVWCNDRRAHFITDEGLYYKVLLDGGEIENRLNALPNKAEIYPIIQSNEHGIYAHRENIYYIPPEDSYTSRIFTCKNRTFITKPVFVDKTMYIGTQDGWVFCIHYGSKNVKWVGHTDGELTEDSLIG